MKISVREAGRVRILDLEGKLVIGEPETLLTAKIQSLLAEGIPRLVINLNKVKYMDTSGIAALISGKKRAKDKGGDVKFLTPSATVYEILSILQLHLVFDIYEKESSAIESF